MKVYNDLLTKAVKAITAAFKNRMAANLLTGRNATIPDKDEQARDFDDFELITWLVVK